MSCNFGSYKELSLIKNYRNMFSKENLVQAGTTLVVVMIALAVHQKIVAPMLSKKPVAPKA